MRLGPADRPAPARGPGACWTGPRRSRAWRRRRPCGDDRAAYLEQLGEPAEAAAARAGPAGSQPASARDHYLLATGCTPASRRAATPRPSPELDQALQLNPRHYWSWLQRGICHQELGEHALAAGDFGACIGLWPEFAWGYFNRGCVLDETRQEGGGRSPTTPPPSSATRTSARPT